MVVTQGREENRKEEWKRKGKERENKIISFDLFGYMKERKEEKKRIYKFFVWFAKVTERKNVFLPFYALIYDWKK